MAIADKLTPKYIEKLPIEELERLIRPCGFYKAKAQTIKALIAWFKKYNFKRECAEQVFTSKLQKELISIQGIGVKTAGIILVYAFYKMYFIVDSYTRRFLLRLGYKFSDDIAVKIFLKQTYQKMQGHMDIIIG